jgi:hypothetical protein
MNKTKCSEETAVANAVRLGKWDDSLREHMKRCEACREVAEISTWMQSMVREEGYGLQQDQDHIPTEMDATRESGCHENDQDRPLPDASLVWWRARLAEELDARHAKVDRAHAAMDRVEIMALFIAGIGFAGWVFWNWYALQRSAARLFISLWPQSWPAADSGLGSFWLLIGVLSAIAILLAYPIVAEE